MKNCVSNRWNYPDFSRRYALTLKLLPKLLLKNKRQNTLGKVLNIPNNAIILAIYYELNLEP